MGAGLGGAFENLTGARGWTQEDHPPGDLRQGQEPDHRQADAAEDAVAVIRTGSGSLRSSVIVMS